MNSETQATNKVILPLFIMDATSFIVALALMVFCISRQITLFFIFFKAKS